MASGSENTTNRVYVSSKEFGWLPAVIKSSSGKKAIVEVKDYEDDGSIANWKEISKAPTALRRCFQMVPSGSKRES